MIFYKALKFLLIDNAISIFFKNLRENIIYSRITKYSDGLYPSLRFPDFPVYNYIEDGISKWVSFDDDNFLLGVYTSELYALDAYLTTKEVPIEDGDLL